MFFLPSNLILFKPFVGECLSIGIVTGVNLSQHKDDGVDRRHRAFGDAHIAMHHLFRGTSTLVSWRVCILLNYYTESLI